MVLYFIGVYKINRTLHGCLEIRNSSTLEQKFRISARPCNILYIHNGTRTQFKIFDVLLKNLRRNIAFPLFMNELPARGCLF